MPIDPATLRFDRQYRTPYSEGYNILQAGQRLGRVDLHYTTTVVYATLVLERDLPEGELFDLIEQIDENIVLSAETHREDFLVTVFRGTELGLYDDAFLSEQRGEK
jgi:hypothetical protein